MVGVGHPELTTVLFSISRILYVYLIDVKANTVLQPRLVVTSDPVTTPYPSQPNEV